MARKVILSRKGFDSKSGGKPSPILNGNLISLPIPRAGSGDFYSDLAISPTESYLDVMQGLGIKHHYEGHLDPDIRKSILQNRPVEWRGLFGQSGPSEGLLNKMKVGIGDIFLFFGWFKEAKIVDGKWKYIHNAKNIHAIYGYLEVDEVFDIKNGEVLPSWANYHQHFRNREEYGTKRNVIYMATESFTASSEKLGYGVFKYNEDLVLTKQGSKKRSLWELPSCFQEEKQKFKCGLSEWNVNNDGCVETQPLGQVQEIYVSDNPKVVAWAEKLISNCSVYK
ncbi:hypothetical protein ACIQ7N_21320 [Lysinibacillus sp. NPDC095746]|uniref:Nmad3 family putative nucleotide modification protein n=1 Tax=Lysinibacillus sp. NPDC095746 TaxID=3364134 RepID=UPI00380AEF7F